MGTETRTLTITVDIAEGSGNTISTVLDLINSNDAVSEYFRAELWGTTAGTSQLENANFTGTVATTSGGVVSDGTVIIDLETDANGLIRTTAGDLVQFFDDTASHSAAFKALQISVSNAERSNGTGKLGATTRDLTFATSGTYMTDTKASTTVNVVGGLNSMFDAIAKIPGAAYDGVVIEFKDTAVAGSETISYDLTAKQLLFSIEEGVTTVNEIMDMMDGVPTKTGASATVQELFTMSLTKNVFGIAGNDSDGTGALAVTDGGTLSGGTSDAGTKDGAMLLGNSDAANIGLVFTAAEYGSDAFVSVRDLNRTTFAVTDSFGIVTERTTGTDIDTRINGVRAIGNGLNGSLDAPVLDLDFSVASTVTSGTTMDFSIVGAGVQLQLGSDAVSDQQARLGISGVSTVKLGGISGRLFELRSGSFKSLANGVSGAAMVVRESLQQLRDLREYLGLFSSYHGADVVLMPDREHGGGRLVEVQSQVPVGIGSLARADSLMMSPDGMYVYLSGFENGSTALFRWDPADGTLTFEELLRVDQTQRENGILATADEALASIGVMLGETENLTVEMANAGLSPDEKELMQLKTEMLLQAIDRAARFTSVDGVAPLDGVFQLTATEMIAGEPSDPVVAQVHDVVVGHATFDNGNPLTFDVDVVSPARRAMLRYRFGGIASDVALEIAGRNGVEAFSFESGTTIEYMADAINVVTDTMGVAAEVQTETTRGTLTASS